MMTEKFNIMLIDDSEVDNLIHRSLLMQTVPVKNIVEKTNGSSALEYLMDNILEPELLPDVIFLDIGMPGMDGFNFLAEYTQLPAVFKNSCRIVMLTTSNNLDDKDKAVLSPYVKSFLLKPLSGFKINEVFR